MITSQELRQKYLDFFREKGHSIIPSSSLMPENDPSVLFTTAGMHPLVPFLMGEKHPAGKRLANFQKCIRTGDIDSVGDDWHLTFFEMLGNWSLGDYFKKEAIEYSFEFLTDKKWLGIPAEKLAVTVFAGDDDAPFDEEAYNIWLGLGIAKERIFKYGKKDNWWGPAGATGPCGPDSEMFFITDRPACGAACQPSCNCGKYVEIWNDVFMQYSKTIEGKFEPLKQKNVDTGMGVERTVAVLNGHSDNYQEALRPIINKIEELSEKKYENFTGQFGSQSKILFNADGINDGEREIMRSMRIIADHLRAVAFIMGDDLGVRPSNNDQGYVVRKLIRRAIRHGRMIGINQNFTKEVAKVIILTMKDIYPELGKNKEFILNNFLAEEEKFTATLQKGLKEFEILAKRQKISILPKRGAGKQQGRNQFLAILKKYIPLGGILKSDKLPAGNLTDAADKIVGQDVFNLFQTYGFPLELTRELAREKGLAIDEIGFFEEMKKHQDLSRTASVGKFKGGLGEQTKQTIKYHTATHLLQAALRQTFGEQIAQKGSNITEERLRFDFTHDEKMTAEQIKKVEEIVNKQINNNLPVNVEEMTVAEAKSKGAIGLFQHKYGDKVKVYLIGGGDNFFSIEICGGPHVKNTGELGKFKIIKEEASSAGIRRIKAILE